MNAHDRTLAGKPEDIATVRYGDGDLTVLKPGRYVICAVSGRRRLPAAWGSNSAGRPGRCAGPAEALARWKQLNS